MKFLYGGVLTIKYLDLCLYILIALFTFVEGINQHIHRLNSLFEIISRMLKAMR